MSTTLPKSTSEQRAPYYEDVETLLSVGFLSHPISINGLSLSMRSLSPSDRFLLRTRAHGSNDKSWKCWVVASAAWMVDGYCVLGEDHAIPSLKKKLELLPPTALDMLFSVVMGLFARQDRALSAVESYSYESASRYLWRSCGGKFKSGIPGSESLGLNHVQQMWAFFNYVEDMRHAQDTQWEGQKFVASTMSSGVKKIDQKDKQRRQEEEEQRQRTQDTFFYTTVGLISTEPGKKDSTDPRLGGISHASTPDELAEDMRRWVEGEEDSHDKIISEYKRKVVKKFMLEKEAKESRARAFRERLEENEAGPAKLVGYTPEHLAAILKDRQPGAHAPGVRFVSGGTQGSREYLYEKYLERAPDSGALSASDGKLVRQGDVSLLEQVSQRQLLFGKSASDEPEE